MGFIITVISSASKLTNVPLPRLVEHCNSCERPPLLRTFLSNSPLQLNTQMFSRDLWPDSQNWNVYVLHQNEGVFGKSIPDDQEISRYPRYFPRAKPEGNHEGRGDGFPKTSRVLVDYRHSPHHQSIYAVDSFYRDGSRNPSGQKGLTVLKSILPC